MLRGRVVAGDCQIEPGRRPVLLVLGRAAALSGDTDARCYRLRRYRLCTIADMTEIPGSRPWCIPVANQKGGVGKTTVALGLAAAIEDSSGSVIVFDADPQQSAMEIAAAGSLPFEVRPALSAAELASIRQVRGVDTVIIDLPGNLTDTPVLGEVLAASDFAVIPGGAGAGGDPADPAHGADHRGPATCRTGSCATWWTRCAARRRSSSCASCSTPRASPTSGASSGGMWRTRNPSSTACR